MMVIYNGIIISNLMYRTGSFSSNYQTATGSTIGNLTLANGSITDSSGAISFDNENLTTTGTLASGNLNVTGLELFHQRYF